MSLIRGNPTTLPVEVSFVETEERFRVGNSPFQERGVEKSFLNRWADLVYGRVVLAVGLLDWALGRPKDKIRSCRWVWVGSLSTLL